ncbi:MAG: beta-N-acetylhexosaminidase [Actinomycetota bacterium]|nr:beta-N-acetylhexosaminidase [Actinomycetota bacterium]
MDDVAVLPRPTRLGRGGGRFVLDATTTVSGSGPGAGAAASLLRALLAPATGLWLAPGGEEASIRLVDEDSDPASERYVLRVRPEGIELSSPGPRGLLNGIQSLRQLLPAGIYSPGPRRETWAVPEVEIEDEPRFSWRGAMLDVSRHFAPLDFLYRFVDVLAMHKLNVFHLHLNDDQGWRFASSRYPRLVEIGAWRAQTRVGHQRDKAFADVYDGTPHGGYYAQSQLRSLVAYAAARNVTIVPEIDLPGHAQAAIAAYPELGNVGPLEVWERWGVNPHVLNLETGTVQFCKDIWDEVIDVFPSRYVHLGGDECPRTEWRSTPAMQRRAAALGVSVDGLQNWFTRQLATHLLAAGRVPVGWDEILEGGELPKGATVMSWRGEQGGIVAASEGFDVVMCPERPCYFDHYQSERPDEPLAIGRLNTLEDVYGYEPVPEALAPEQARHVLGTQLTLWREYLPDTRHVEYMALPRLCALAEVAWSAPGRELGEFMGRLSHQLGRFDELGLNYRPLDGPLPAQRGGTGVRRRFDP